MLDFDKLAAELHADAVERGFWDVPDSMIKHVVKMHSELSEAVQEDRCDRPLLYVDDIEVPERITDIGAFDGRKPEGIAAELADFVMMALDMFAETEVTLNNVLTPVRDTGKSDLYVMFMNMPLYSLALHCHDALCALISADTAPTDFAAHAFTCIVGVELWLEPRGVNLWDVIRLKQEYNRSRPKLHGRKY